MCLKRIIFLSIAIAFSSASANSTLFLHDTRKDLNDTDYPWSTFGLVEGKTSDCTGQLVGPRLVLTAAHCVTAKDGTGPDLQNVYFSVGYRNGKRLARSRVIDAKVGTHNYRDLQNDWAILLIQDDYSNRFGYLGVAPYTAADLIKLHHTSITYLAGYMRDWRKGESPTWEKNCRFFLHILYDTSVVHDCSTTKRSSGGAIIVRGDDKSNNKIVALNVGIVRRIDGPTDDRRVLFEEEIGNVAIPSAKFYPAVIEWLKR